MTQEERAFIRDESEVDAWTEQFADGPDEEEPIAECENCGTGIYIYDNALGMVVRERDKYRTMYLCRDCYKQMLVTDILELLDVLNFDGEGEEVVDKTARQCRKLNAMAKKAEQDRIAIAANMVKAATLKEARA